MKIKAIITTDLDNSGNKNLCLLDDAIISFLEKHSINFEALNINQKIIKIVKFETGIMSFNTDKIGVKIFKLW